MERRRFAFFPMNQLRLDANGQEQISVAFYVYYIMPMFRSGLPEANDDK